MKALSIKQPIAYLAGCLLGDAWLSSPMKRKVHGLLCLRCKDADFAQTFASAIEEGFSVPAKVGIDERGYCLVRKSNGYNRFAILGGYEPIGVEQKAAWLRGFFDSEGNVILASNPACGPNSWNRRILMSGTNLHTLHKAMRLMRDLNIHSQLRATKPSAGHMGSRPVFNVVVSGGREHLLRFANSVGSSIARKQACFDAMPGSYEDDPSGSCRMKQAKGAEVKRAARAIRVPPLLPSVLSAMRSMQAAGIHPSFRKCTNIKDYHRVRALYTHGELLTMIGESA